MSPRKMPHQKPATSEQSVGTPTALITAACAKLRIAHFYFDLAADKFNTVCGRRHFNKQDDALARSWVEPFHERMTQDDEWDFSATPWNWLNPPYEDIAPWAERCLTESERGASTALLVPSSTGATWWNDYVHGYAYVLAMRGRPKFNGHTQTYPKDTALILYTPQGFNGMDIWDWRNEVKVAKGE